MKKTLNAIGIRQEQAHDYFLLAGMMNFIVQKLFY
jgi:hypothetical protein